MLTDMQLAKVGYNTELPKKNSGGTFAKDVEILGVGTGEYKFHSCVLLVE